MDYTIEELAVEHPDWQQLVQVMDEIGQKSAEPGLSQLGEGPT